MGHNGQDITAILLKYGEVIKRVCCNHLKAAIKRSGKFDLIVAKNLVLAVDKFRALGWR